MTDTGAGAADVPGSASARRPVLTAQELAPLLWEAVCQDAEARWPGDDPMPRWEGLDAWGEEGEVVRYGMLAAARVALDVLGFADGEGLPRVRLGPCPVHKDSRHAQVRTGGAWLCTLSLRGLDAGWPALEASLAEARQEAASLRERADGESLLRDVLRAERDEACAEVARLRELLDAAGLSEVADEDAAWRQEQGL